MALDYTQLITSGLSTVGGYLGSQSQKDATYATLDTQRDIAEKQRQIAELTLQGKLAEANAIKAQSEALARKPANNTALYIGLGIGGVVILGLVAYVVTRK